MKKRIALFVGLLFSYITLNAQKNHVELNAGPKMWMNSLDVYHDNFGEKSLSSDNRVGYGIDLTYRRTTKGNLYYGAGTGFTRYSQKLRLKYRNMGFYIPGANSYEFDGSYTASMSMITFQAFVGYSFKLKNNDNAIQSLDVDLGVRTMFSTQGELHMRDSLLMMNDPRYDYGILEWSLDNFAPVIDLNITYRFQPKKTSRYFYIGLNLSGYPGFNYPIIDNNYVNGFSRLGDYKNDGNGNRVYGNPGEPYGEGTFPRYISIGFKLGVDLFKF